MWMVAANFRRTYSPSRLAWVSGLAATRRSAFIKWTGWTLAKTYILMTHHKHCRGCYYYYYYYCSEQSQQQTAESPVPSQPRSSTISASKPDIVYAHIGSNSQPPAFADGHLYANVTPKVDAEASRTVIYSEIQINDSAADQAAQFGDLYAEVKKR